MRRKDMSTELVTIVECTELFGVHPQEGGCNFKDPGIGDCSRLHKRPACNGIRT
jgi:hypothetical protein